MYLCSLFSIVLAQQLGLVKHGVGSLQNYAITVFAKIAPFIVLLCLQYITKIVRGIWVLPSFAGFFIDFLWLIVPIFSIASSFSWWFYRKTGNILPGALFNALLIALIATIVFPF